MSVNKVTRRGDRVVILLNGITHVLVLSEAQSLAKALYPLVIESPMSKSFSGMNFTVAFGGEEETWVSD